MIRLITFLITLTISCAALSDGLFESCTDVREEKSYQPMKQYLLDNKIKGEYCQRLNSFEFIYTGYMNFYYCNFKSKNLPCSENESSRWYPNLTKRVTFLGENGKRFVLFITSSLSHGIYSSGYHVFLFRPKSEEPRGYKILWLREVGEYNGTASEEGLLCSNLENASEAIKLENFDKNQEYMIVNEGKRNVGIRFIEKITFCETQKSSIRTVEYTWNGNDFVRSIVETR